MFTANGKPGLVIKAFHFLSCSVAQPLRLMKTRKNRCHLPFVCVDNSIFHGVSVAAAVKCLSLPTPHVEHCVKWRQKLFSARLHRRKDTFSYLSSGLQTGNATGWMNCSSSSSRPCASFIFSRLPGAGGSRCSHALHKLLVVNLSLWLFFGFFFFPTSGF